MNIVRGAILLLVFLISFLSPAFAETTQGKEDKGADKSYPPGVIRSDLLEIGYSGSERLRYDVAWSGGIKIGELHLHISRVAEVEGGFEIRAFVTTKGGAVNLFYPINDLHLTRVKGDRKLPYYYEIWQKEGYSYEAHRLLRFDQQNWTVHYMKNEKLEGDYQLDGEMNNEFSAFFNSRLMDFALDRPFVVPTFADKRRVEVVVHPIEERIIEDTLLGDVQAIAIMPVLRFEGLYEKKGDTVIWYTNDECRVPVKITSKISIGSLTATLAEFSNPACSLYEASKKRKRRINKPQKESK